MKEAIKDFRERLRSTGDNSVRLFYYAGHGVEARGQNYLIPIGADIRNEVDFLTDAVPLDWVLARMESANNSLNIVILDACRNNPYGEERGGSRGLAPIIAPSGTFISYAAAPGQAALDGEGEDNSPYSAALARTLVKPELQIEDVFKHVRAAVMKATDNRQGPWEAGSLMGEFYFVETKGKPNVDLALSTTPGNARVRIAADCRNVTRFAVSWPATNSAWEIPMSYVDSASVAVSSRENAPAATPCPRSRPADRSGSSSPGSPARPTPSTARLPTAQVVKFFEQDFSGMHRPHADFVIHFQTPSMIIHYLYVARPFVRPTETNVPLRILCCPARSRRSTSSQHAA